MKRNVLFIWIPRTGGTSLWSVVESSRVTSQRIAGGGRAFDPTRRITTFQHSSVRWLLDSGVLTREWLDSAWVFSVVRNTWDRLVSVWSHLSQGRPDQRAVIRSMGGDFESFLRFVIDGRLPNLHSRIAGGDFYATPQTEWLSWPGGEPDFVGSFRKLSIVRRQLGKQLGTRIRARHSNASRRRRYQEYYTPKFRDAVGDFYAEEIDRFGFTFEGA